MLQGIWQAIDERRFEQAEALLRADQEVLVSRAGQMALGYLLAHTGRQDEARSVFQTLRDAHRDDPWEHIAVHQLARVERLAGQHGRALALLDEERALVEALDDHAHELAVNALERARNLRGLGRLEEARAALDACERHAGPADPETLARAERERGELSRAQGHAQAARIHFERALAAYREAEDEVGAREVEALMAGGKEQQTAEG